MSESTREKTGTPVDLTKEEFIEYHLTIAKQFGALRMQMPVVILFLIYLVVIGAFTLSSWIETGQPDIVMLMMLAVTVVCGAAVLYLMPWRVKKTAVTLYEAGNINGYYGEITVTPTHIIKDLGSEQVSIPLTERTMYLETPTFMAFSTVGENRAVILPARCVTQELATAVRQAIFAENCRVVKKIVKRMTAAAAEPMDHRDFQTESTVLTSVQVQYDDKEIKKQLSDMNMKKYVDSLPLTLLLGLMLGAMLATAEESLPVFFVTALGTVIGMLLLSMLSASSRAKRMITEGPVRILVTLTDIGVQVSSAQSTRPSMLRWSSVEKAVERTDSIDIIGAGQFIRIPKHCVDDVDALINIVDAHFQV